MNQQGEGVFGVRDRRALPAPADNENEAFAPAKRRW